MIRNRNLKLFNQFLIIKREKWNKKRKCCLRYWEFKNKISFKCKRHVSFLILNDFLFNWASFIHSTQGVKWTKKTKKSWKGKASIRIGGEDIVSIDF